jgi:hypothetical protein
LEFIEYTNIFNGEREEIASKKEYSIAKKFLFFDIRSAMLDPSDIKGLPSISGSFVKWLPDIVFRIASRPDFNGLIFFDEVNQALPAVQSALYQVILDNCAGTVRLSDGCLRAAAGNRTKDRSNVNSMSKALMQRFINCELAAPTVKEWVNNYAHPKKLYPSVISYLQYKTDHLNVDIDMVKEQKSFANPRNWDRLSQQLYALDSLYTAKTDKYFQQLDRLADANIGGEAGVTFAAYMKLHKSIDIDAILKEPTLINTLSIDKKWFAMDMLVERYDKQGVKLVDPMAAIFLEIDGDLAVNTISNLRKVNKLFLNQFKNSKKGIEWYMKSVDLFLPEERT